jgi:hypothetical protein
MFHVLSLELRNGNKVLVPSLLVYSRDVVTIRVAALLLWCCHLIRTFMPTYILHSTAGS